MVTQNQLKSLREFETKEYWERINLVIEKHKPKPRFTTNEQIILDYLTEKEANFLQIAKMMKEKGVWIKNIETHTSSVLLDLEKKNAVEKVDNIYKIKS